jgi:hypothetical protein
LTEDELKSIMARPCLEPQLFLLDAFDRATGRSPFCFIARFPGDRMIRVMDENIPSTRHVIDPMRSSYYRDKLIESLQQHKYQGDAALLSWTNWVSMSAAIGGIIRQFNKAQEKRARAENPMRFGVSDALIKPHVSVYYKRSTGEPEPTQAAPSPAAHEAGEAVPLPHDEKP